MWDRAKSAVLALPFLGLSMLSFASGTATELTQVQIDEAQAILDALVEDYKSDPMAINSTFGIKLGDTFWTVNVERKETPKPRGRLTDHVFGLHQVRLVREKPSTPTWYFEIASMDVLRKIAAGEVNAGTAAMQSFGSDQVGVEVRGMDGFEMTAGDEGDLYLALSHFFTTGVPEITTFGQETSLPTHGASATSLHTMKGFRIAYVALAPNEVANEDPQLEFGQMPNLFIVTKGRGRAYLADQEVEVRAGMSVFIPPYVRHQIMNDSDELLEGLLVLYGDNSDFAFGTSYPAFLEDLNEFYRDYQFRRPQEGQEP